MKKFGSNALSHQADPTRKKRKQRSKFTTEEDAKLLSLIEKYGTTNWIMIANAMETRTPRQCHDRYVFYLDPSINKAEWSEAEENLLIEKFNELGTSWKLIATFFNGRTEIDLKNKFLKMERLNRKMEKKRKQMLRESKEKKKMNDTIQNKDTKIPNTYESIFFDNKVENDQERILNEKQIELYNQNDDDIDKLFNDDLFFSEFWKWDDSKESF